MKLLIITQKVDRKDDVLGFFHAWIKAFALHFEKVTVICLEEGLSELPKNVSVFSLGKKNRPIKSWIETVGRRTLTRLLYVARFYRLLWEQRVEYNVVFVHMNPEYVVLAGFLWKLLQKKIALWYVHRQVNLQLRIAEKFAHVIFSTTKEAFRLKSGKIQFVGHGIDVSQFTRKSELALHNPLHILHVGRITPIKNLDVLIEMAVFLKKNLDMAFTITLVGSAKTLRDERYEMFLKDIIERENLQNEIIFVGPSTYEELPDIYRNADVSINLTPSGGMDKAVLESIASGTIAFSANNAFKELFGAYAPQLLYNERDAHGLAVKVVGLTKSLSEERKKMIDYLCAKVQKDFSLERLVHRISDTIQS